MLPAGASQPIPLLPLIFIWVLTCHESVGYHPSLIPLPRRSRPPPPDYLPSFPEIMIFPGITSFFRERGTRVVTVGIGKVAAAQIGWL